MDNAVINPFLTSGYLSAEYFCDREEETNKLTRLLTNGNNVALISSRRMGNREGHRSRIWEKRSWRKRPSK